MVACGPVSALTATKLDALKWLEWQVLWVVYFSTIT